MNLEENLRRDRFIGLVCFLGEYTHVTNGLKFGEYYIILVLGKIPVFINKGQHHLNASPRGVDGPSLFQFSKRLSYK